ncbi:hypothetical protein GCM10028804_10380 [Larkinella terrae]
MNEHTWFAVLQALPTAIDIPLVIFDNPVQAEAWILLNGFEEDKLWIVTNDDLKYWVVAPEVGNQLIHMGFTKITATLPPVPQPALKARGGGKV